MAKEVKISDGLVIKHSTEQWIRVGNHDVRGDFCKNEGLGILAKQKLIYNTLSEK